MRYDNGQYLRSDLLFTDHFTVSGDMRAVASIAR